MTDPSTHLKLETDLAIEILKSERLRIRALMILLAGISVALFLMSFVPKEKDPMQRLTGGEFPFASIITLYTVAFFYELGAGVVVRQAIARRRSLSKLAGYTNALVETSLPTFMLILLARTVGPEIALNSPLPMVYFLFIGLSTLLLGFAPSMFTGAVAAVEFAALGLHYFPPGAPHQTFFNSPFPNFARALVMLAAGAVCGFVGSETRRRAVALLESASEKHRVENMFGQYVSPDVVEQLLHQPVTGAGEVRQVTVMFLDIRDFTTFSERRTPVEVVDYLNTLFREMIAVVGENHGMINKFLGDGFMACFGAPLSDGRDTQNAVKAAVEIVKLVDRLNREKAIPPTRIGIGLHAGPAVTGSVGSDQRKEYTLIGDTVNLASRVEQLNKQYDSMLLVTDTVWAAVKNDYSARALDPVTVKGRAEPVALYALL